MVQERTEWTQDRFIVLDEDDPRNIDRREPGGDRIRFRLKTRYGRVVDFVVQYETPTPGVNLGHTLIIRSDWSHQLPHYDVYNLRGAARKILLPRSYEAKETMQNVLTDLQRNWRRYRNDYFGEGHDQH